MTLLPHCLVEHCDTAVLGWRVTVSLWCSDVRLERTCVNLAQLLVWERSCVDVGQPVLGWRETVSLWCSDVRLERSCVDVGQQCWDEEKPCHCDAVMSVWGAAVNIWWSSLFLSEWWDDGNITAVSFDARTCRGGKYRPWNSLPSRSGFYALHFSSQNESVWFPCWVWVDPVMPQGRLGFHLRVCECSTGAVRHSVMSCSWE